VSGSDFKLQFTSAWWQLSTGAWPSLKQPVSGNDPESGRERQREERSSIFVFDFNSVPKGHLSALNYLICSELPGGPHGSFPRNAQTRQFLPVLIQGYGVAVNMEEVSRHGCGHGSMRRRQLGFHP
jgi:hypothetical protein